MTDLDQKQQARCHWFLKLAVKMTNVSLTPDEVTRLAMAFNSAMHDDGAMMLWKPQIEDVSSK